MRTPSTRSDTALRLSAMLALAVGWHAGTASAGPPLIADDPNTIGPGNAQPIFATVVLNRRDQTLIRAPILDMTVGVVDSLDVILVVSLNSLHRETDSPTWQWTGVMTPGIKWQLFRRDRGSLCLSPAFSVGTRDPGSPALRLPFQGEIEVGDRGATLGFDVGYVSVWRGPEEWFASVYGQVPVTKRLTFQSEIWSFGSFRQRVADLGLTVGATYLIFSKPRKTLELITAVSPGLVSFGRSRLDVRAYFGFQYTFARPRRVNATRESTARLRPLFGSN